MKRLLKNKVVVITGASAGIGAATARCCFDAGMCVVAGARRLDKLEQVVAPMGDRGLAVACDVTSDDDVQRLFTRTQEHFGRVDVVFANAGYGLIKRVDQTSDQATRDIFETNFYGTMRCIHAALPYLRQTPNGLRHMLICSSAASEIGIPNYGVYAATKAAQDSVAQAMRSELDAEGIVVTSVHPVGTRTEFFQAAAQRVGQPDSDQRSNTPSLFEQTSQQVARRIVKAMRYPKPEVWPMPLARFALGAMTMFPGITAWALRRRVKKSGG